MISGRGSNRALIAPRTGSQQATMTASGHRRSRAVRPTRTTEAQIDEARTIMPATPPSRWAAARINWNSQCRSTQGRSAEANVNGSRTGTRRLAQIHWPERTCHQTSESNSSWQPSKNAAATTRTTSTPSSERRAEASGRVVSCGIVSRSRFAGSSFRRATSTRTDGRGCTHGCVARADLGIDSIRRASGFEKPASRQLPASCSFSGKER